MSIFAALTSLADITAEHLDSAAASPAELKRLLARCAELGRGGVAGCGNVLLAVARLARDDVRWLEGEVRAELTPDGERTVLSLFNELGFGLRERLVPSVTLTLPFEELAAAALVAPDALLPLRCRLEGQRLVLAKDTQPSLVPQRFEVEIEEVPIDAHSQPTMPPPSSSVHTRPTVPSELDPRTLLGLADDEPSPS